MLIAKGSKVKLSRGTNDIWIARTEAELQALRDADKADGRWHDDGGEPILYGAYSGWNACEDLKHITVVVTAMRPKWQGWHRRPMGLRAGFCKRLNREVLFKG